MGFNDWASRRDASKLLAEALYGILKKRIFTGHRNSRLSDIGRTKSGRPVNVMPFERSFKVLNGNAIGFDNAGAERIFGYIQNRYGSIVAPNKKEIEKAIKVLNGKFQ